jgi:hypothetical protein
LKISETSQKIWIQIIFWIGFVVAVHGSVEQAIIATATTNGSALWSSWFGEPIIHHYLSGFILIAIGWIFYSWPKKAK